LQDGGYFGWPDPERIFHIVGLTPGDVIPISVVRIGTNPDSTRRWSMDVIIWDGSGSYITYLESPAGPAPSIPPPEGWMPDQPASINWEVQLTDPIITEAYISVHWEQFEGPEFPNDPEGQLYLFRITIGAGGTFVTSAVVYRGF